MLAIAISLLFGLAAFAALAVLGASLSRCARRARAILAELAEIERRAGLTQAQSAFPPPWTQAVPAAA
jgi:hypothetical protein